MNLIAHRGLHSKNTKENTLAAIKLGNNNQNIDGVEFDVRLTKDHKVVVIHDDTIDRTSNGKGKVREMTLERIKRFNFGTWIKRCRISTLDEVLQSLKPNSLVIIEIKDELDRNEVISSKVLETIKKYPNLNIWLKSFSLDILEYLKKYGNYPVGLLVNKNNIDLLGIDFDFYSISKKIINNDILINKLNKDKKVMIWTINSIEDFENLKQKIGDNIEEIYIISDSPLIYKNI